MYIITDTFTNATQVWQGRLYRLVLPTLISLDIYIESSTNGMLLLAIVVC